MVRAIFSAVILRCPSAARASKDGSEVFNVIYDCQQLITEQLIDYVRMDAARDAPHHEEGRVLEAA
jgi:hypothetical protein